MKKYNLSQIMKNAWSIRREKNIKIGSALKQAWAIAKCHSLETKIFNLVKESNAKVINGRLAISRNTSEDTIEEIKANEHSIISYLSGACFRMQTALFDYPVNWVVLKKSYSPYISQPPIEMFRGTAGEVDDWMAAHKDDRCYLDEENQMYNGKYVTAHCA